MNRKRIAKIVATGMITNLLVVATVTMTGGQVSVVKAQEVRLVNPEDINKLEGIKIKTLETEVESQENGDIYLTFKGIDPSSVKTVSGTLSYEPFKEKNVFGAQTSLNLVWDSTKGKVTASGLKNPGLYKGKVYITFNDGTQEVYDLTLRKTYAEKVLTAKIDVGVGTISVTDIQVDGQAKTLSNDNILELYSRDGKLIDTIKDKDTKFTVPGMKFGDTYKIVYKENGQIVAEAGVVLLNQKTPTTKALVTNEIDDRHITEAIKLDYDVSTVSVTSTVETNGSTYLDDVNWKFSVDGVPVLDYLQTEAEVKIGDNKGFHRQGGAKISVSATSTTDANMNVTVGGDKVSFIYLDSTVPENNFLPANFMTWGPVGQPSLDVPILQLNVGYGIGNVTIGDVSKQLYDLSNDITNTNLIPVQTPYSHKALGVIGGVKPQKEIELVNSVGSSKPVVSACNENVLFADSYAVSSVNINYDTSDLSHGYSSVPVVFTTEESLVLGKTVTELQEMLKNDNSISWAKDPILPEVADTTSDSTTKFNTKHTTSPVTASIVIAKDSLDGVVLGARFEKISATEGRFILSGGHDLPQQIDRNKLAENLIVGGSSDVSWLETKSNGDMVFKVTFGGEIPSSTIDWSLGSLTNKIDVISVDAVNITEIKATNENAGGLQDQFNVQAQLNFPTDTTLKIDNKEDTRVTFKELTNGSHRLSTEVNTGKYQGIYTAGLWVTNEPMSVKVSATSSTNNRIDVTVDADFFNTEDYKNVSGAKVVYKKLGDSTAKEQEVALSSDQIKEDAINLNINAENGKYEVKAVYDYKMPNGQTVQIVSNIVTVDVTGNNNTSGGNSNITGTGGSSVTTGSSSSVSSKTTTINVKDSKYSDNVLSVNLKTHNFNEQIKDLSLKGLKYKADDGTIVTETYNQYTNVSAKINGDNVEIYNLVPDKHYAEIILEYKDRNNNTHTLILKDVLIKPNTELESYLENVYKVVFGRPADEVGYHFHLDNLKQGKVSLRDFLLNILNETEFLNLYKTPEEKIDALYKIIVSRTSDSLGKQFWVDEYKKAIGVYGSETLALKNIADRMVNEKEVQETALKLGVKW